MNTHFQPRLLKVLDAAFGPPACRLLARPQPPPEPPGAPLPDGRLLVIRPGGIGDMLLLLPTLQRLRHCHPSRPIDVLCERRNAEVIDLAGLDAEPLVYDRTPLRALRALWRRRYALAIDSEQFHHFSAVMAKLSGAPRRIGFNVAPRRNGLYTRLVDYTLNGREDLQFARLADAAGCPPGTYGPDAVGCLRDVPLPALPDALRNRLRPPILAIHAGATQPEKQIPVDLLTHVCRQAQTRLDMQVVLTGGAGERVLGERLREAVPELVNLCGQLPLRETASLLRQSAVLLGADSGITHLAIALGKPAITLFGPTDPRKWAAGGTCQTVLREPQPCSPCALFGYTKPCNAYYCMRAIQGEAILDAITRACA